MSRKLRFRGHALHPAITDFPIALLPLAFLWQLVALWQGGDFWWKAAFWTMVAGLAAALLAAITGFLDYLTMEDRKGSAFRTATNHMLVMLTGVSCFLGSLIAQGGAEQVSGTRAAVTVGFAAAGALLLMLGGWLGGELVFRHGVAVQEE